MGKLAPLIFLVGLFLAAPAQAKGPDRATLFGPGLERPLVFGYGADAKASLGLLTQRGGFWVQAFRSTGGSRSGQDPGGEASGEPRPALPGRLPGAEIA